MVFWLAAVLATLALMALAGWEGGAAIDAPTLLAYLALAIPATFAGGLTYHYAGFPTYAARTRMTGACVAMTLSWALVAFWAVDRF